MAMRLHNTLSRRVERFEPADPNRVLFYTCGPTVYDFAHIGNFRAFLVADALRRWLESPLCVLAGPDGADHPGPREVVHVMNITDVGHMTDDDEADGAGQDKMELAAQRLREAKKSGRLPPGVEVDAADPRAVADFYTDAFVEDARRLGLKVVHEAERDPTLLPRAADHVREMLEIVLDLLDKGAAYRTGGAVYFDTQAYNDRGGSYGALSGNTIEAIRAGAGGRVEERTQRAKRHPADFLLWKADRSHLMRWSPDALLGRSTELGEGYPGWHIECSAMALARLRPPDGVIDLHSGGEDNIFPHHECEIAQSRSHTGAGAFARCWLHARFLLVEGRRMSKSAGNFFTLRDLLARGFGADAIRLELIKTHYRSNANFTEQGLRDSRRMIDRWRRFLDAADASGQEGRTDERARDEFADAMHDDLNTAGAVGALNAWINRTDHPTRADGALLREFDAALGVLELERAAQPEAGEDPDSDTIDRLIEARAEARKAKDFTEADRIRDELREMGVEITDTPQGTTWSRQAAL